MKVIREIFNAVPVLARISRRRKLARLAQRYEQWRRARGELPMPHYGKQLVVAEYAERLRPPVFIETGTYTGHMVLAMLGRFEEIYSIELDPVLCEKARRKFRAFPYVQIVQGDSSRELRRLLPRLSRPCLFWLDAHYSGGATAKGDLETPIAEEVTAILDHPLADEHVLLIDDARCFDGTHDYPDLTVLRKLVLAKRPNWTFEVRDDIIRAHAGRE
jgi:hypothetical protein